MNTKIMIVDAHPVYVGKTEGFLGSMGLKNIQIVAKGSQALEAVRRERPEIVVISATLPDADSVQLIQGMRAHLPQMAVIVQTGLLTDEARIGQLKAAGANFVIPRLEKDWSDFEQAVEQSVGLLNKCSP